jgi:hypothetical protein
VTAINDRLLSTETEQSYLAASIQGGRYSGDLILEIEPTRLAGLFGFGPFVSSI